MSPSDSSDGCPEPVRLLLRERVTDFEELEVLLLLMRRPEARATVRAAADETRLPTDLVERAVAALCACGLLVRFEEGPSYLYRPASASLAADCEQLRRVYDEDPLAIVRIMSRLAIERVRMSTPSAFANAFRFRKPPTGDGSGA